ncbi:restriction endonuclease [Paenibacillus sp. IB182496]|uniref:Restriction endonuclease n=1 Tax=Paenibacillus sabuli TaxID=2772509 RepID=A0A927BY64_9BACL|nr:restriction endonuclease [Paenibacillus sabuli]MBD2847654.1 restriction endonuclease [Paenibacillus sabuli]
MTDLWITAALAGIIIILGLLFLAARRLGRRRYRPYADDYDVDSVRLKDIDRMEDGSAFEMYLYRLFLELGYDEVYKTTGSRDYGADLVFTDREGIRNVVQAKRYAEDHPVGIGAVQEVYSCMRYYNARKAIVIASSTYTASCETLAGINHVKLLDRGDLAQMIADFRAGRPEAVMNRIEAEPRLILASWNEATGGDAQGAIRKDYKAEEYAQRLARK